MCCVQIEFKLTEDELEIWHVLKLNKEFHQWYSYYIRNVLISVLSGWDNQLIHVHTCLICLSLSLCMHM